MTITAVVKLTGDVQQGDLQKVWKAAQSYSVLKDASPSQYSLTQQMQRFFSNVVIDDAAEEISFSCKQGSNSPEEARFELAAGFEKAFGNAEFTDRSSLSDGTPLSEISIERRLVGYQLRFIEP